VRHNFRRSAHADLTGPEFIFQSRVHPLAHGARFVAILLCPRQLRRGLIGEDLR
jgi:hypothetical protein